MMTLKNYIKIILNIPIIILFFTSCSSDFYELLHDKDDLDGKNRTTKVITSFQFLAIDNESLPYDINGTIINQNINITVPYSTNLNSLVPLIEITGKKVTPGSGSIVNFDPNTIKIFTVTAEDNSSSDYSVIVSKKDLIEQVTIPSQGLETGYEVTENLNTGIELYTDELYTINSAIPSFIKDNNFIKLSNNDRVKTEENYLTITTTEESIIYVAYDITYLYSLPGWLSSWEYKYESFTSTNGRIYYIYAREFESGEITLGANWATGANKYSLDPYPDQYVVIVRSKANRTFIKGINFNGPAVYINGENWLSQDEAEFQGFTTDASYTYDAGGLNPIPAADADTTAMLRKSIYESAIPLYPVSFEMNQSLENGEYEIYLYFFENSYTLLPPYRSYNITINDNISAINVGENFDYKEWSKLGPFLTSVNNGNLKILFEENYNAPEISGMSIYRKK